MRIAVVSDIHAHPERLEAALELIKTQGVDQIWCLGDLVGYGSDPAEAVALVREVCDVVIAGNHDAWATGKFREQLEMLPYWLQGTLKPVRAKLPADDFAWLARLSPTAQPDGVDLAHGSLEEPYMGSLQQRFEIRDHLAAQAGPVSFVGHSHVPQAIACRGRKFGFISPGHGELIDLSQADRWILNPGTLGLRQYEIVADRRPGWLVWDKGARTATWWRLG